MVFYLWYLSLDEQVELLIAQIRKRIDFSLMYTFTVKITWHIIKWDEVHPVEGNYTLNVGRNKCNNNNNNNK